MHRRHFLTRLAGAVTMTTGASSVMSCTSTPTAPSARVSGRPLIDVRWLGALGNGAADDTDAFAEATRQAAGGGDIIVPAGDYRIDPRRNVRLPSHSALRLSPGAVLRALPVADAISAVVSIRDVENVTVSGGTIIGERHGHLGTSGEWGMGIEVRGGTNVTIDDVTARDCWGDGFYIGSGVAGESRDITIRNSRALGNRRQGLSIVACLSGVVTNCEFSGTHGTAPQSGIDVEPNRGYVVRNLVIRGCTATANAGWGIVLSGHAVTDVTIEDCRCVENQSFGGIAMLDARGCTARGNVIEWNLKCGVHLEGATGNRIVDNVIRHNSQVQSRLWPNVIVKLGASGNVISGNRFVDDGPSPAAVPGPDVSIAADCASNIVSGNALRPRTVDTRGWPAGGIQNSNPTTVLDANQ